ncbi:glycoside hydrolase family 15 [Actinomycetota bacterium]
MGRTRRALAGLTLALGAASMAFAHTAPGPNLMVEPALITTPDFRLAPQTFTEQRINDRTLAWVRGGAVPGEGGPYEEMSRAALHDLHDLTVSFLGRGQLPPAGAGDRWNYFWPRDGAFVLVALDRTGHHTEARQLVDAMARIRLDPAKGYDARYLLDGSKVRLSPRGPQSDGCGWVAWALGTVSDASLPPSAGGLRAKCLANLYSLTGYGSSIPRPSPDYWEVDVRDTSLGTVAPMLAGVRASAARLRAEGRSAEAAEATQVAQRLTGVIKRRFAPDYERFGRKGGLDAATAMLLPPFNSPDPTVMDRWRDYQREAIRSSGGLAPGTAWKEDGTSWTPQVALVAYTAAASGDRETAERWLDWLDAHRVPWGSLPEKVTRSGNPAGPAPLLWTDSLVLLTLAELEPPPARGQ